MSKTRVNWLKSALVSATLAFTISGCSAKTDNPIATESNASADVFVGTYLFDIRDLSSDFGKAHPQAAKRYSTAFNSLLAGRIKLERTFVSRITSGPSTQGEAIDIDGQSGVAHATCQAHRCDIERMGLYYIPASNQMAALLWSRCEETILGSPPAAALATLRRIAKMPVPTAQDVARCKKVSAAYE